MLYGQDMKPGEMYTIQQAVELTSVSKSQIYKAHKQLMNLAQSSGYPVLGERDARAPDDASRIFSANDLVLTPLQ